MIMLLYKQVYHKKKVIGSQFVIRFSGKPFIKQIINKT